MFSSLDLLHCKNSSPIRRWLYGWRAIFGLATLLLATAAQAGEEVPPARELQKLIPPDASVVLTVEHLREHVHDLLASRLVVDLQQLPVVRAWFDSQKYEQLETARDQIEGFLQTKLTEIRDQILGDAVVIALRLPLEPPFDPGRAHGILTLKPSNPALLKRLIDRINTTQKQNGEIADVMERKRGEMSYFVRTFPAGSDHRPEAYVFYPDGIFAVSNNVDLITDFIDHKIGWANPKSHGPASLADLPRFQEIERKLPAQAFARLYINPRPAESLLKNSNRPRSPGEVLIERYVGAMEAAGAALVISEGRVGLDTAQVFEPRKFQDLVESLAVRSASTGPRIDHVPATALAVGSLQVDFAALYRIFKQFVPEAEHARLANAEVVLKGVLLGQDLPTHVLPALGPRILAFVDAPTEWIPDQKNESATARKWPFPVTVVLDLQAEPDRDRSSQAAGRQPTVASALDNALNTLLALVTFHGEIAGAQSRLATHEFAGVTVKTLDPPIPFAYAVDHAAQRLVLGDSAAVVERYLASRSDRSAIARFASLQARAFPAAHSFLCIDLAAVATMITTHRARVIGILASRDHRSRGEVGHDLDQFLALSRLFDAAYLSTRIDSDSATVFHGLGLLVRPGTTAGASTAKP